MAHTFTRRDSLKAGIILAGAAAFPRFATSAPFEMKAGAAKCVVTPEKPLKLTAGKLDNGTMLDTDGKEHDLFARALVLNDGSKRLAVVTFDMNSLDVATPILRERCRKELGIDAPYLLLLNTHNHQGPMPRWKDNFPHQRWLAERIFGIIKEAIAAERGPVSVSFGTGNGYYLRSSANAATDYEVQVIKVTRGNQTVAVLCNQPTHPAPTHAGPRSAWDIPAMPSTNWNATCPHGIPVSDACGGNQYPYEPGSIYKDLDTVKKVRVPSDRNGEACARRAVRRCDRPHHIPDGDSFPFPLAAPPSYEEATGTCPRDSDGHGYDHGTNRGHQLDTGTRPAITARASRSRQKAPDFIVMDEGWVTTTEKPADNRAFPMPVRRGDRRADRPHAPRGHAGRGLRAHRHAYQGCVPGTNGRS